MFDPRKITLILLIIKHHSSLWSWGTWSVTSGTRKNRRIATSWKQHFQSPKLNSETVFNTNFPCTTWGNHLRNHLQVTQKCFWNITTLKKHCSQILPIAVFLGTPCSSSKSDEYIRIFEYSNIFDLNIYLGIRSYHFLDTNIFGYSFVSTFLIQIYSDIRS